MDIVLKCKLGHPAPTDISKFIQIIFPSTQLSFNCGVLSQTIDKGRDFEIHLYRRKIDIGYFFHQRTSFDMLDTSGFLYCCF